MKTVLAPNWVPRKPLYFHVVVGRGVVAETAGGKILIGNQSFLGDHDAAMDLYIVGLVEQKSHSGRSTL